MAIAKSSVYTHKPRMSHGSLSAFSPRDLIKRKQSISLVTRQRGYSASSTESSISSVSDASSNESEAASAASINLDSDSDMDEGHGVGPDDHAKLNKLRPALHA